MDVLALGVLVAGVLGLDAEGVGTEVVTLGLEHVGGEILGAVAVVEGQSGAEGGSGDTPDGALGDNVTPAVLGGVDGVVEEVVEEKVLKVGVAAVGVGDVLEEDGTDDAATAPHEGDLGLLELPAVVLGSLRERVSLGWKLESCQITYGLHEHEALGVGDDLGGVKGLLKVGDELLAVAGEVRGGTLELLAGAGALGLEGRKAAREDSLANESHGLAHVKGVDGGPLAGTLLASRVEDLLEEGSAILVVVVHDVAGDLNEERVKHALVPLSEDVTDLLVGHANTTLHDVVGL